MNECYNNVVGMASKDCSCNSTGRPTDYNTSESGLFLDSLAPISTLLNIEECGANIWDKFLQTKTTAINKLIADTNAKLATKFTVKRQEAQDQAIGQIKANDIYDPSLNYALVAITCAKIKGGVMRLNKLGGIFSGTGAVSVQLYDNVTGLIDTYTLNTTPDVYVTVDVNRELPLYSKYVPSVEYYLVYIFDPTNLPKDTTLDCGCGNNPLEYNWKRPYYRHAGSHKQTPWADYVMVGSKELTSLTEIANLDNENRSMSLDMMGLVIEADFVCKIEEVLCKDSLDFSGNQLAMSLAFALYYQWAHLFAETVILDTALNRATLIDGEEWREASALWNEKYIEHLTYIVENANYQANDCLACKDLLGMVKKGLLA